MTFLKLFTLVDEIGEHAIATELIANTYNNYYPLHIFCDRKFQTIEFNNITIFYGGNGSGKSTLLNIIAKKINAIRKAPIEKGHFFDEYVKNCCYELAYEKPTNIKSITSDDVFDYLLDIRSINANIERRKDTLSKEYLDNKYNKKNVSINNYEEYEEFKNYYDAKKQNMSKYIRQRLGNNTIIENSNGESALLFWEREITENGIYILDEPENSLSAENQIKLKKFIEESSRFFNCQFIISTHSPFLLNLDGAKIYDLDTIPVTDKKWTELTNVKIFHDFFKEHEEEFN